MMLLLFALAISSWAQTQIQKPDMKLLQGTFFQPFLVTDWDPSAFDAEFKYLADARMTHVIWQWTVDSKEKTAWYPTTLEGYKQVTEGDAVEVSLQAGLKNNLAVWLGLNNNGDWFGYHASKPDWLRNEFAISRRIVKDMWEKYSAKYKEAIAGFYLPLEVDNIFITAKRDQKLMAEVYRDICDYIHNMTGKPVMVAPYFNQYWPLSSLNPREYAAFWHDILLAADIDIVALQDGIGVFHSDLRNIADWYMFLKAGMQTARPKSQLWTDIETFVTTSLTDHVPAKIERVIKQIEVEAPYVKGITSFSFCHYDSPHQGFVKQYQEYMEYVRNHGIQSHLHDK